MAQRLEALPTESNIDIDKNLFNPVYLPYLHKIYNYEVYYGGAASGKSTFVGQKLAIQMTIFPGRNCVVLRKQKKDCVKSCWGEIYNSLKKFGLKKYWIIQRNPEHVMTNRINGNVILFEGLDDVEDIKSIKFTNEVEDSPGDSNITDIWYEEVNAEDHEDNIDQLDVRLRDPVLKNRLILSFNPVSRAHFLYNLVTVNYKMDGVDALILKTTYKDNKWCKQETIDKYERYKYTNQYMYQVYTLGNWGTMGQTVFDSNKVSERISALEIKYKKNPPRKVTFSYQLDEHEQPIMSSVRCMSSPIGETTIYIEPNPKRPYVAAVDTAGDGDDEYAVDIVDNITDEQVATFSSKKNSPECMPQVYGLLKMYNDAIVAPEFNFSEYPVQKLKEWDYINIYQRERPKTDRSSGYVQKLGFLTTSGNRKSILDNFIEWAMTNINKINDIKMLSQMLVFTYQMKNNKGFMGAEPGEHDDFVMARAILLQAQEQQVCEEIPEMKKIEGYWTKGELNLALQQGRVDKETVDEYILEHEYRFTSKERKVSKYAR